jgi:mono/diheme cytochrome c family protein
MRTSSPLLSLTLALGLAVTAAAVSRGAAPKPKSPAALPAQIAHGKALVAGDRCANCHGANLAGRQGFAPSLHASGVLQEYNASTFARVMNTGITNDGGHVRKPMPVYHLKNADSTAMYAYLKALK